MKWKTTVAAVILVSGGVFLNDAPAGASVLFQSVPDLTGSVYPSGICSACFGSFQAFDTFSLGSSALIDAVTVSVYPVPFPVDIDLSVWSISSGLPDSELFSETFTPSQFTLVSYPDRTLVTVEPVGLSLLSGTYDISFYNPTGLALKSYYGGSGLLYQEGHGFVQGASLGFTLNGDVAVTPVPSALPLFVSGLVGVLLVGWRSSRKRFA